MVDCGNGMICNFTTTWADDCIRVIATDECICNGPDTCEHEEVVDDPQCPTWACYAAPLITTTPKPKIDSMDIWLDVAISMAIFVPMVAILAFGLRFLFRLWSNYSRIDNPDEAEEGIGMILTFI